MPYSCQVHAYIIAELKSQMPSLIGKDKKKEQLIKNLVEVFQKVQREHNISPGDFPSVVKFREQLRGQNFSEFHTLKPKLIEKLDNMLARDIPRLMAMIPQEEALDTNSSSKTVKGGAFTVSHSTNNPFASGACEGVSIGAGVSGWVVDEFKPKYDKIFESLGPRDGKLAGAKAKKEMVKSKLPNTVLGRIWKLADVDHDGQLDEEEFALAMYLIKVKIEDDDLPEELPGHLIPPGHRHSSLDYD